MLVLAAALVAAVFAVPATASAANWKQNGNELSSQLSWYEGKAPLSVGAEKTLNASGSFNFSGGANCSKAEVSALLVGGPGEAAGITKFSVDPSSCSLVGTLKSVGCTKVNSVTYNTPNGAALLVPKGGGVLAITNTLSLTYAVSGSSFCNAISPVTISGNNAIATMDNSQSIGNLTFSGTLGSTLAGSVVVSGGVAPSPAGAFGVDTAHSVALTGVINFALGECGVDGRIGLDPGSSGRVTKMDLTGCIGAGYYSKCKVTAASAGSLPWTATDEGSTIRISGIDFTVKYDCGWPSNPTRHFTGELTATPNNASAISTTMLTGTLAADGESMGTNGIWYWNPAGVYGL